MRTDWPSALQNNTISESTHRRYFGGRPKDSVDSRELSKTLNDLRWLLPDSVVKLPTGEVIEISAVRVENNRPTYVCTVDGVEESWDVLTAAEIRQADDRGQLAILSGGWNQPKMLLAWADQVDGRITDVDFRDKVAQMYDAAWWDFALQVDGSPRPTYYFLTERKVLITYPQL